MMDKRGKKICLWISSFTFIFFFLFFFIIHPFTLGDTDDWLYATMQRGPIPIWKGGNPSRVFAETFMPLVSIASGRLLTPITGNVFASLSLGYAVVLSVTLAVIIYALCMILYRNNISVKGIIVLISFFVICHFWIFRKADSNNDYMLHTVSSCSLFYYLLPNLLNVIAVLWLYIDKKIWTLFKREAIGRKGLFLALMYFSIFSNIWGSIILASFCGSYLIFRIINALKTKEKLRDFFSQNSLLLLILVFWLVSQIFEMNGKRAEAIGRDLFGEIGATVSAFADKLKTINVKCLGLVLLVVISGMIVEISRKEYGKLRIIAGLGLALLISFIYLILSCSKTGAGYITRSDVLYCLFFYVSFVFVLCGSELFTRLSVVKVILPLLLICAVIDCNSTGKTFIENNLINLPAEAINNINNDIVSQLINAEEAGESETVIWLPKFGDGDNFPYVKSAGMRFSNTLSKLGVLYKPIQITQVEVSEEKNNLLNKHNK